MKKLFISQSTIGVIALNVNGEVRLTLSSRAIYKFRSIKHKRESFPILHESELIHRIP